MSSRLTFCFQRLYFSKVDDLIDIAVHGGCDRNLWRECWEYLKKKLGVYISAASCKINVFIRYIFHECFGSAKLEVSHGG